MKVLSTYQSADLAKKANICLCDEIFVVEFFYNRRLVGEIEYPNKNILYVQDAAKNYIAGILTEDIISTHCRVS